MATATVVPITPEAPKHLPAKIAKQWQDIYAKAFAAAQTQYPDSESAQRSSALKAANALLAIPAPQSYDDAQKLDAWQILERKVVADKDNNSVLFVVTADGRKYSFPVPPSKGSSKG